MSWDGIRDERILNSVQRMRISARARGAPNLFEDDINALTLHIDALHHIMGYCAGLLHDERTGMTVDDRAWSTVAACEVLLREHIEDPQLPGDGGTA